MDSTVVDLWICHRYCPSVLEVCAERVDGADDSAQFEGGIDKQLYKCLHLLLDESSATSSSILSVGALG